MGQGGAPSLRNRCCLMVPASPSGRGALVGARQGGGRGAVLLLGGPPEGASRLQILYRRFLRPVDMHRVVRTPSGVGGE